MTDVKRPTPGVSLCLFGHEGVLIVKRARAPYAGLWSLPGGKPRFGEPLPAAALRELREETGLTARLAGLVDVIDLMGEEAGERFHYVLTVFAARHETGVPRPASDVAAARFAPLSELHQLPMTPRAEELIVKAAAPLNLIHHRPPR